MGLADLLPGGSASIDLDGGGGGVLAEVGSPASFTSVQSSTLSTTIIGMGSAGGADAEDVEVDGWVGIGGRGIVGSPSTYGDAKSASRSSSKPASIMELPGGLRIGISI